MIQFLRKIRKKLVSENKFSKYLIYAIGEIILVVFGILIALQINNWNDERQNHLKETRFIIGMKNDLGHNIQELDDLIERTEFSSNSSDSILEMSNGNFLKDSEISFADHIISCSALFSYKSQEASIQDVLGSRQLSIIRNDTIRKAIGSWELNLKPIREWETLEAKSNDAFTDYIKEYIRLDKILFNNENISIETKNSLLRDIIFLNNVTERRIITDALNRLYQQEKVRLINLMKVVDNELN